MIKIIRTINIVIKNVYFSSNVKKDSGNNSSIDIPIIIVAVKDRQKAINLSIFLILRNTINPPITVESPAIVDTNKALAICMISPLKYMRNKIKKMTI